MQYFGKSAVKTKNSTYHVDWNQKTIMGSRFDRPANFTGAICHEGEPMIVYLCTGEVLKTSTVIKINMEG